VINRVFQDSEIVTLLFTLATLPVLPVILRGLQLPGRRLFVAAYLCMAAGYVFTVVEGIIWRDAFNFVEHLAYAASGLCMLAGVIALTRAERRVRET
jgi:hypothetical protein